MPTRIHPPSCLLEVFDDYLFPTIDFSRVAFFTGFPPGLDHGQNGLTMPSGGFSSQINVYLRGTASGDGSIAYSPCDFESFLVVAHELVHVLQIMDGPLGGRIPGYWVGRYLGCWLGWTYNGTWCDNQFEKEAYEYANGCPDNLNFPGALRTCLDEGDLAQSPCDCSDLPWYHRSLVPGTTETFFDALPGICPDLVKRSSNSKSWKCLLSPWALILALLAGIIYGIVSIIVQIVTSIIGWVWGLFAGSKNWIWYTVSDGGGWGIPDVPVTSHDHTKTSDGPAAAAFNSQLYLAYKSADSNDLWYNVFDGQSGWLEQDIRITRDGHTQTSAGPALAVFNGKLYMAYKSADSNDLWYSVFDGQSGWLEQDIRITQDGHSQTSAGPALAAYNSKLYLAYKSADSDDLWYNVFDGQSGWLEQDIRITQDGHTQTSAAPALAVFNGQLYMAYKSADSNDLWYNVFDGQSGWLEQDIRITQDGHSQTSAAPALAVFNGQLYMAYRSADNDDLWYNVFDGQNWLAQDIRITRYDSVYTARGPALAALDKLVYLIYRDNS
jgi:hypothetical protein